ncbi:hypothetical protein C8J57DRAFT_1521569 [Mycena rebaudengoi]|nr:hypothetical protein C8J57DRAFT_1521569 [Mycena rebaudengoi]
MECTCRPTFVGPGVRPRVSPDDAGGRKNALKKVFRVPNWVKMCPPLRDGHGCVYMKYTVLLFEKDGKLRRCGHCKSRAMDWREIENHDRLPLPALNWRAGRAAPVPSVPGGWEGWGGKEGVLV